MMSIAGITSTRLSWLVRPDSGLPVVCELKGHRDVLRLAEILDHELQRVLVLADDAQLITLDPHLDFGRDVLDALPKVAGQLIGDACVQLDLDLAAALPHRLGVARLEHSGRPLSPGGFLPQNL